MASRVYHAPQDETALAQFAYTPAPYTVLVDGQAAPLRGARVSAMPFNRWWPGHQRPLDQTEIAWFVTFAWAEGAVLRVTPKTAFKTAVVRPLSRGVVPEVLDGSVAFPIPKPGQYTLEIDGTRHALHIFADPAAAYAVQPGADVIYFGAGVHDAGAIELTSGQTLYIDEGAVVYGRVHAIGAAGVRILGRGVLDSSRVVEDPALALDLSPHFNVHDAERPGTIVLEYCTDVEIEGVTVRDPVFLAIRPVCCRRATLENVKVIGCWRYNSDGIDFLNSVDCAARDCFVRTFDDSLCIKGFFFLHQGCMFYQDRAFDVAENIVFERCVVWNEWSHALEVGIDLCARAVRHCAFRDCDVIHGQEYMMDVTNADYAPVSDILFENIRIEYDEVIRRPFIQTCDGEVYPDDPADAYMPYLFSVQIINLNEVSQGGVIRGTIRGVTFRNIRVTARRMPPSILRGYDAAHGVEDVVIEDLRCNGVRVERLEDVRAQIGAYVKNVALR